VQRWWDENNAFEQTYSGLRVSGNREANPGFATVGDMIAVASFFNLPVRAFLLRHTSGAGPSLYWQRWPSPPSVVLGRTEGKSLVTDPELAEWQQTAAVLEHAHRMYLSDQRDYTALPARLRPAHNLLAELPPPVLLTYAGLLLRDVADKSGMSATGGSQSLLTTAPDDPNVRQEIGVRRATLNAGRALAHALRVNREFLLERFGSTRTQE
jgi:hypothetical protein